jgi:hypothetical protein
MSVAVSDWSDALQAASDRAVSQEAKRSRLVRRFVRRVTPSESVDQAYENCLQALREAFEESSRPGWDAYGAHPVSEATLARALAFLDALPSTLLWPEISPHPDGELAFEWSFGPRRLLTVSVNESGRLSYAALFGRARVHGTEFFLDDAFPDQIALALRRLYSAK